MGNVTIESAAIRLTDTILGYNEQDLEETLKAIALDIGVSHIAYMRFAPDKSSDASLLTGNRNLFVSVADAVFSQAVCPN